MLPFLSLLLRVIHFLFFFTSYLSLSFPLPSYSKTFFTIRLSQSSPAGPNLAHPSVTLFLTLFPQEFDFLPPNPYLFCSSRSCKSFRVAYAEIFFHVLAPSHHSLSIPFVPLHICTSQSYLDLARSFELGVKNSTRNISASPVFSVCLVARIPSIPMTQLILPFVGRIMSVQICSIYICNINNR